jgi:CYTH domain-containing protein
MKPVARSRRAVSSKLSKRIDVELRRDRLPFGAGDRPPVSFRGAAMPLEIERKFLVANEGWRSDQTVGVRFCQGYLAQDRAAKVRIRRAGDRACVTIKGPREGIVRSEFEYLIPVDHAEELLRLCHKPLIQKTRYTVWHVGKKWSVDVFGGANVGLVLAEIELRHPDEQFPTPSWLGPEVTHDRRYGNSALAIAPITGREAERSAA